MFFKKQKTETDRPRRSMTQQRREGLPGGSQPMPRGQVYSYRASRSQRQETLGRASPEQTQQAKLWKERFKWLQSMPRIFGALVILLIVVMLLRLDSHAAVVPMDNTKGQVFLRSLQTYEEAAARIFSASWLNGNKLTINTAQVSRDLVRQFPELKTVSISLPIAGNRPVVYVQPATPALVLTSKGSICIVDTDGKALITGNQVPELDKLKLPVISDESGLAINPGTIVLPQSSVSFISEVVGQLKAKELPIQSLTLPAEVSELHLKLEGESHFVKFNLHGNAREEAGAFLATRQHLKATAKSPVQYIDVRVPGRAYYR
jgi:hypothetical protein